MLNIYLGLPNYDDFSATNWESDKYIGYILGDYFCNKRMFKYGDIGLFDAIKAAKEHNKEIIYQTPMYITDRIFDGETNRIRYLYEQLSIKKILVQDIGLLLWIKEHYPEIVVIWSRLGKSRNSIMNHGFIEFLLGLGIHAIEVEDPEKARAIAQYKMDIFSVYGNIRYNTLSRDCYNKYFLNIFDGMCNRECNSNNMELQFNQFHMGVNGHMLGYKIKYDDSLLVAQTIHDCATAVMLYAEDLITADIRQKQLTDIFDKE